MNDIRTCARTTKGLQQTIYGVEDGHYPKNHPIDYHEKYQNIYAHA